MLSRSAKQLISGSFWGILVKVFDALVKFFTIPILVSYFGKNDYGLFALAVSLNTYLQIMDLGMNVGSIRYFSIWLSKKEYNKLIKVTQSSILFYGGIGFINALIIFYLAYHPSLLDIETHRIDTYRWIMLILGSSIVFSWLSNVIVQILTANEQLGKVNQSLLIANILNIIGIIITIHTQSSLEIYFLLYTLSNLVVIPLNIYHLKGGTLPVKALLLPKWNWNPFKEILNYSVSIFAMGIFQFSANHLRPIILTKQSVDGIGILTDYRVIQTIAGLVIAFGSVIMQVLLPTVSKLYAEDNHEKIKKVIFEGTKLTTLFIGFFCFALITCSKEILYVYMGESYGYLSVWLNLWLLTVLITMHNAPVASLVLASAKTKVLVYCTAVACLVSLPVTYFLVNQFSVGAAVIGYLLYIVLVIGSYYFYYIPKVLKLSSIDLFFKSVIPATLIGVLSFLTVTYIKESFFYEVNNNWTILLVEGVLFAILYIIFSILFVFPISKIKKKLQSLRSARWKE